MFRIAVTSDLRPLGAVFFRMRTRLSFTACAILALAMPAMADIDSASISFTPPAPYYDGSSYWTDGSQPGVTVSSSFSGDCLGGLLDDDCAAVLWHDGSNNFPDPDRLTGGCNSTWTDIDWTFNPGPGGDRAVRAYVTSVCIDDFTTNTLAWSEDTEAPTPGTATAASPTNASPIEVNYSGASDTESGLQSIALWYKFGAGGTWTNTGLTSTGGSGSFNFTPSDGDGTYYFDLVATDNVGNTSSAATGNGDHSTVVDTDTPEATSILRQNPVNANTNASQVTFAVTFDEAVTGVTTANFSPNGTSTQSGATIASVSGSGANWSVTVNTVDEGAGDLTVDLDVTTGIEDAAGNELGSTRPGDDLYMVDRVDPIVSSITRFAPSTALTNSTQVTFEVLFSKVVSGFTAGNVALDVSGAQAGASLFTVLDSVGGAGPNDLWRVTVNTAAGDGSLSIDVIGSLGTITDSLGNSVDDGFTAGEIYTVDRTAPTVQSINRFSPTNEDTNAATVSWQVTFSESVTGVTAGNYTLVTTGGQGAASISGVSGGGATWGAQVSTVDDAAGTIRLDLDQALGAIQDAAGNLLSAARTGDQLFNVERIEPNVTISSTAPATTNVAPVPFDIDFDESVVGFTQTDIIVSGGLLTSFTPVSGSSYDIGVTPSASPSLIQVTVNAGVCADAFGNSNNGDGPVSRTFDSDDPTVILSTPDDPGADGFVNTNPTTVNITFSEPVTGFDPNSQSGDLIVTNGTYGTVSGSGASYTVDITPAAEGPISVTVPAAVAQDGGANPNSMGQLSLTYDITAPTVTITSGAPDPTSDDIINALITFSEEVVGMTAGDVSITNGSLDVFFPVGDDQTWAIVVAPAADGPVTITITAGAVSDPADNLNVGPVSLTRTYDSTGPQVTSITRTDTNPTVADSVGFNVVFDEPVNNLSAADFSAVGGAKIVTGASVLQIDPVGATSFSVVVSTGAGAGTLGLNVVPGGTAEDAAGNPITVGATGPVYGISNLKIDNDLPSTVEGPIGGEVVLTITASSDVSPLTYQWFEDTGSKAFAPISGAASNTITLDELDPSMTGNQYYVSVSDALVTVNSNTATLIVSLGVPVAGGMGLVAFTMLTAVLGAVCLRRREAHMRG
jgi:hypothetical protein